jgi:hypothetical protein
MIEEMRARGGKASIKRLEAGWVLEDNWGMRRPIEMFGAKVDKIHRIYEKRLAVATRPETNSIADRIREEATP